MPNLVAEAAHLVLVEDVTRTKTMNIGGGAAFSIGYNDASCDAQTKAWTVNMVIWVR